jgi:hypothetical protein
LRVASANIKCFAPMSQEKVVHDINATGRVAGVIGWQEIQLDRYRTAIEALPNRFRHEFSHGNSGQVVSWNSEVWERVDGGKRLLCKGSAKICNDRWIVWVLLKHKKSGRQFIFHTTHYPAKAWANYKVPRQSIRQAMWNKGNKVQKEMIDEWVRKGYCIVGTGDYNRRNFPVAGNSVRGRKVRYLTPKTSIDFIFVINGKDTVLIGDKHSYNLEPRYSDHKGRAAKLKLVKRKINA